MRKLPVRLALLLAVCGLVAGADAPSSASAPDDQTPLVVPAPPPPPPDLPPCVRDCVTGFQACLGGCSPNGGCTPCERQLRACVEACGVVWIPTIAAASAGVAAVVDGPFCGGVSLGERAAAAR